MLPARTRLSIVDKSPRLTPVQISLTKRESISTRVRQKRNSALRAHTRFRHFKCSHEKLSGQSGEIFAMEFGLNRPGCGAGRRSTFEDVYEIFNGLCERL